MLSPAELAAVERGQLLKRYVRSAAALQGLYDDVAIGDAVGRTRMAVGQWWRGARPEPATLRRLAEATGLSIDELSRFVYYDGPPPRLDATTSAVLEGARRDLATQDVEGPDTPPEPPVRPPRGSGAGHG